MDGFLSLVRHVAEHVGVAGSCIHTARRRTSIPGFYRPTKDWDAIIVFQGRLLAALEFKSQVGALGNNFNNRVEEALGSAADLNVAHRRGAYDSDPGRPGEDEGEEVREGVVPLLDPRLREDPRPP